MIIMDKINLVFVKYLGNIIIISNNILINCQIAYCQIDRNGYIKFTIKNLKFL